VSVSNVSSEFSVSGMLISYLRAETCAYNAAQSNYYAALCMTATNQPSRHKD